MVINDSYKLLKANSDENVEDDIRNHLQNERRKQAEAVSNALAGEVGLPTPLFMRKKKEFK